MKNTRSVMTYLVWGCTGLCIVLVVLSILTFRIKDMALFNPETVEFNSGYVLEREDGSRQSVNLPYQEKE